MQYTIPHCKHCKYNTSNGNCTQVMMEEGKFIKTKPNSRDCRRFEPISLFEEKYKDLLERRRKRMLTPKEARVIANKFNKEKSGFLSSLYQNAWMKHQKYLEESISERAGFGEYRCMSENLYDSSYQELMDYDPEKLEEFLKDKIKKVFGEAWGYKIIDNGSNYLIISWEEEDLA